MSMKTIGETTPIQLGMVVSVVIGLCLGAFSVGGAYQRLGQQEANQAALEKRVVNTEALLQAVTESNRFQERRLELLEKAVLK